LTINQKKQHMKRHRVDWKPAERGAVFTEAYRLLSLKDGTNWTHKKLFGKAQEVLAADRHRSLGSSALAKEHKKFKAWRKENHPKLGRPVGAVKKPATSRPVPRQALSFCPACGTPIGLCAKCGLDLRKLFFDV